MKKFQYIGADKKLKPYLKKVIDGEYEVGDVKFNQNPTVLDLGANIGSYTYYIVSKYPDARVIAFEPVKETAQFYLKNMLAAEIPKWNFCIITAAVFPTDASEMKLYLSDVNSGMHSAHEHLTNTKGAQTLNVQVVHPKNLPECDILKMDIEGAEFPVLEAYLRNHKKPTVVSFEFHYFADRVSLEELLGDEYILVSAVVHNPSLGTMNFVHKDAFGNVE